ncbi:MAG: tRNA lysidine(34) synthetase TilS [Deltaproteobacteria bacterium]|nr:tRNA lysidine(34) synthetase TilS [Deltaproteobacteria bacterium]
MIGKIRDTIVRHGMLSGGETVIVSVSGGADSTVLLRLLTELKEEYSLRLIVSHLNHNLRGKESLRDMMFVKALSKKLGLEFAGKTLAAGEFKKAEGSLQEAARDKRYAFLEETAGKYGAGRIALGHTEDDQAETVLMRLLKGSSLAGLAGIPPVRGPFIRPLIEVTRVEIEEYAREKGVGYLIDSSNLTDKYLRNDIRLNLIPYLKQRYNPNIVETIARTASVLASDDDYLEKEALRVLPEAVLERKKGRVVLDRKRLLALHEALSARVFLSAAGFLFKRADISSTHINSFRDVINGKKPNAVADLPGLRLAREYDRMIISIEVGEKPVFFSSVLKVPGRTTVKGAGVVFEARLLKKVPPKLSLDGKTAYFDYDEIEGPIAIRQMVPGDRMVPFGMKGHKKLKEIFIEKKVPRPLRAKIPLLTSGGEILWAAGVRHSDFCKVKKATKRVLKVEVSEG